MARAKVTTTNIAYKLITAAIFAAALPPIIAKSSPGPAPAPAVAAAPGPIMVAAPSPGPDCFSALLNLSDCLTFVDGGSNLTKPDPACCPEVVGLLNTQPICLCELLGNSSQFGVSVDTNRALKLPPLCNVTTPPVSMCAAAGVPVTILAPSPSQAVAGSNEGSGSPSNLLASNPSFLIGLALVLFTSFF